MEITLDAIILNFVSYPSNMTDWNGLKDRAEIPPEFIQERANRLDKPSDKNSEDYLADWFDDLADWFVAERQMCQKIAS
jgi:hypothetical protein